jgi:hypothetical protein
MIQRTISSGWARSVVTVLFLWSAGRVVIAAGDGAGFLYEFLLRGDFAAWAVCQIPGWIALCAEVVAFAFIQKCVWYRITCLASLAWGTCIVLFVIRSETPQFLVEEIDRVGILVVVGGIRIAQLFSVQNHACQP